MAIVDDRRRLFIREQESNTNQDAEYICKIYHGAFFSCRAVRFEAVLDDFAFNKTSTHRGITQNMLTAPQRRILQSENRTALWRYIVKTRANKPRLSSFRVSELYFQRVQALPTFRCCCTLLVQHVSACWRRIVAPFVWYTLYVLQYAFSSLV